jgi:hypothetical protein
MIQNVIKKLKKAKVDPEADMPLEGDDLLSEQPDNEGQTEVPKPSLIDQIKGKLSQLQAGQPLNSEVSEDISSGDLEDISVDNAKTVLFDGSQSLTVNGKRLVIGVLWEGFGQGDTPKSVSEKIHNASKGKISPDLFANLKDEYQIGLAVSSKQLKSGDKVGATSFSERRMGRFWLAAFELPHREGCWWIVAMRDGQVYEDSIHHDLSAAQSVFLENLEAPDWQRTIAPSDWSINGAESYSLGSVISPSSGLGFKPVKPIKTYLPYIVGGAIVMSMAFAGNYFHTQYQEKKAEEDRQMKEARKPQVRVSIFDYPWFEKPRLEPFFDACIPQMEQMLKFVPGWKQDVISCSMREQSADISTSWKNESGYVHWMMAAFPIEGVQPLINGVGDQATMSQSVEFTFSEDEEVDEGWTEDKVDLILKRRIQTLGVDIKMAAEVRRLTPQQRSKLKKGVFNRHDFKFQTSGALYEYASLFSDVPAVVPDQLVYNVHSGIWNVSFKVYHQAILPQ